MQEVVLACTKVSFCPVEQRKTRGQSAGSEFMDCALAVGVSHSERASE
jgi:hypothetical protein